MSKLISKRADGVVAHPQILWESKLVHDAQGRIGFLEDETDCACPVSQTR
jgi:hypothetical protein